MKEDYFDKIKFVVTIDTEEEGLWGNEYKRHDEYTVENIFCLDSFQKFCDRLGIVPTYLIDYPVATQKSSVNILKNFLKQGVCEIGTHLHPWCNPPYEEELSHRNSYPHNLSPELQRKKLKILTKAIQDNFGVQPISYRAGRFGFNESSIKILEELEYEIDTSIVPYRDNKISDEPSFGMVQLKPYYLDYTDIRSAGDSKILEIPITVEFTRSLPKFVKKIYPSLPDIGIRRLLRNAFSVELVWLRPSYSSLDYMIKLADQVISSGVTVLNMMFHSTELMPGASPYNKTQEDVDLFLKKIENFFLYLQLHYEVESIKLKTLYKLSN